MGPFRVVSGWLGLGVFLVFVVRGVSIVLVLLRVVSWFGDVRRRVILSCFVHDCLFDLCDRLRLLSLYIVGRVLGLCICARLRLVLLCVLVAIAMMIGLCVVCCVSMPAPCPAPCLTHGLALLCLAVVGGAGCAHAPRKRKVRSLPPRCLVYLGLTISY